MKGIKRFINSYVLHVKPPYKIRNIPAIFATFAILVISPAALLSTPGDISPVNANEVDSVSDEVGVITNSILIKVAGNNATGRGQSLNRINSALSDIKDITGVGHKDIKQIVQGNGVGQSAEIFSWYKLTLDAPREVAIAKIDRVHNRLDPDSPAISILSEVIDRLRNNPNIEAVEPEYIVEASVDPNDTYYNTSGSWGQTFGDLYGLHSINAASAWDTLTDSSSVVVASIDTGVDRNHPDISSNMWVNELEIPGNNIDDDGNGYVDDYYGWDWVNNDNDPMDDHGHGTHTSGTIAATGNNSQGVVGVSWTGKIMALKFLSSGGSGSLTNAILALEYAANNGAKISSNSWGCLCESLALEDAIAYVHEQGMVTVTAAGNNGRDALDFSPAMSDYAITVSAIDYNNNLAYFSNKGEKIDVSAPGVDILSLKSAVGGMCSGTRIVGDNYCFVSGTSMAAPHVAGLAALVWANNPDLTNEEVRQVIRTRANDLGTVGKDSSHGYGLIDAGNSVASGSAVLAPIINSPKSRELIFGTYDILGSAAGDTFSSFKIEAGLGRTPSSWTTVYESSTPVVNGTLTSFDTTVLSDGEYIIRITAFDVAGNQYQFQIHDVEVDNFDAKISFPGSLAPVGTIDITGTVDAKNGLILSSYTIDWAPYGSQQYSSEGITLENEGLVEVVNAKLASFDTSSLTSGASYGLRINVTATNGSTNSVVKKITIDPDIVSGWPKPLAYVSGLSIAITPAFGDINGDGQKELVVLEPAGLIHAYTKSGDEIPGFPVEAGEGFYFNFPPTLDDLDGDGDMEIIATATDRVQGTGFVKKIFVLQGDGSVQDGWPLTCECYFVFDSTPAVADLDSDGLKELIYFDFSKNIYAVNLNGQPVEGFPVSFPDDLSGYIKTPISTVDIEGDGFSEFAIVTEAINRSGVLYHSRMYLFDHQGNVLPGWPNEIQVDGNSSFAYSPVFGDLDGDGVQEIISFNTVFPSAYLFAWEKDGSLLPGWPKQTNYSGGNTTRQHNPSVADIDNDGIDEFVIGASGLLAYDIDGLIPGISNNYSANIYENVALSDVDNDGKLEFISVKGWNLYYFEVKVIDDDGKSILWSRLVETGGASSAITGLTVSDMDNNGRAEIAIFELPFFGYEDGDDAYTYLWELPASIGTVNGYWPMAWHDASRTSNFAYSLPSADPNALPPVADETPPTIPENLNVDDVGTDYVQLSWSASTDDTGVEQYNIYRDNTLVASIAGTSYGDSGLSENTTYSYHVTAEDSAGNVSSPSESVTVTTATYVPQETQVSGVVTSSVDGAALVGATVTLIDPSLKGKKAKITSSSTNSQGQYLLIAPAGLYNIEIKLKGYQSQNIGGVELSEEENKVIDFILNPTTRGKDGGGGPNKGNKK